MPSLTWGDIDTHGSLVTWGDTGLIAAPSYFLPPTETYIPPRQYFAYAYDNQGKLVRTRAEPGYVKLHAHPRAVQRPTDPPGFYSVGSFMFRGGYWNGPLTDAQVTAIVDAGLGDRIVEATDPGLLPAGLD